MKASRYVTAVVIAFTLPFVRYMNTPATPNYETELQAAADTANQSLPKMIDAATRFDHISAGPGNKVTDHFTVVDDAVADALADHVTEQTIMLRGKVCTELMAFRKRGTTVVYLYQDQAGREIAYIAIDSTKC